ncbi:histidine kinase [Candidatus Amarolinea dominans]|uniref:GAF domain-containing sensor histidine kinase n=1 Tax=Candidatus Amarolinea dominans TaxID=3140696 RepID=UPI001DAC6435|nr:hypothetical protein [Anaerolineae bacterium]
MPCSSNGSLMHEAAAREQPDAELTRVEPLLARFVERLNFVHDVDRTILTANTLQELAVNVVSRIHRLVPYDYAAVVEFDLVRNTVYVLHQEGGPALTQFPRQAWPLQEPCLLRTQQAFAVLAFDDIGAVLQRYPGFSAFVDSGLHSVLSAPLHIGTEATGGLVLATTTRGLFTVEHVEIVREVCDLLSVGFQNVRLRLELQRERERLQGLSRRLLATQETERRHLARELHDEVGQILTIIKINLQTMQRRPGAAVFDKPLRESIGMVESALQQVRNLSLALRPSLLDDLGLAAAMRWYVNRQAEVMDLTAHVEVNLEEKRPPPALETACFRIAQEALTNVARHAAASTVWVTLQRTADRLSLTVRDDGGGFDVAAARERAVLGNSIGLLSMQERALLTGGHLVIESAVGAGTTIQADFPWVLSPPDGGG